MIYRSRYRNFEIVVQPSRKVMQDDGQMVIKPGRKIKFQNGVYETEDKKEIEFLRNQKHHFGVDFWEIDPVELEKQKKAAELSKTIIEKIQNGEIKESELQKLINGTEPTETEQTNPEPEPETTPESAPESTAPTESE